jgi:predicted O-methyltransferase YrrM
LEDGFGFDDSTEPIYRRLLPPPAEVLDHVTIMKAIASTLGSNINYLEYGVSTGHSLLNMAKVVHKAFGVDVVNNIRAQVPNNTEFFKMTTDRFSEEHVRDLEFSLCFIDADHAFSSAYKDFSNIIKYIKPGGYVFLHDTYPCAKEFLEPYLCNDCYKTPLQIKKDYPSLEVLTLPLQPGLTIVRVPP